MAKAKAPQINDLIFKELIKRGYALEGNTRIWNIADSKLWYLKPEQAQSFLDLEKSEDYQQDVIQKEIDLINQNIDKFLKQVKGKQINIVDIGCGDGKKAVLFINALKGQVGIRYCPIDISDYMIEKALNKIKQVDIKEIVKFQWNVSDFENLENISNLLRNSSYKNILFLLLGNTLGNFEINELLYEIRSSMQVGDYILIGNGLNNKDIDYLISSYDNEEMDKFLTYIPIQLGLKPEEVKFGVRFQNSRIEMYYTILINKEIGFQNKKVIFNKGDQILTAVSYKYTKEDFENFLEMYFEDVKMFVSNDGSYALALCKKE